MLSITDPDSAPLAGSLDAPGGFAWWYADLLDDRGNGLVLVASWGLPFLPGRASAARRGAATPARDYPSLALTVLEGGEPVFYLLQALPVGQVERTGGHVRFGRSTLHFENGGLDGQLDLDAPGGRLVGVVRIDGTRRRHAGEGPMAHVDHEWTPLTGPATGTWDLHLGDQRFAGAGGAYLDRNAGRRHLDGLGLGAWSWARVQLPDRLRVGYALWSTEGEAAAMIVDVAADGATTVHRAAFVAPPPRRNLWRLPWWPTFAWTAGEVSLRVEVEHRPDDGPFYQRTVGRAFTEVGSGAAVAEFCEVGRIDQAWQRPLVEMCVHRPAGRSSVWLPLFAGPRRGRLGRLLGAR